MNEERQSGLVAIIGGSGVKDTPLTEGLKWERFEFEDVGFVEYQRGRGFIFIPRHGRDSRVFDVLGNVISGDDRTFGPSCTQYLENLVAARLLGADVAIATTAVGSLTGYDTHKDVKELGSIETHSLVVPDDFDDQTGRYDNVWGKGLVSFINPRPAFDMRLREIILQEAIKFMGDGRTGFRKIHNKGRYVCIPGDLFGAETSGRRRARDADIVGMTICPETQFALQLGMRYAVMAFPVDMDYDADHEGATLKVMGEMSAYVPDFIRAVLESASEYALNLSRDPKQMPQLKGKLIFSDLDRIESPELRKIAVELKEIYGN